MLKKREFEIYRQTPPKKVNHGFDWDKTIDFVRDLANPGVWYVIAEWETPSARQARSRLGRMYDDMEFQSYVDKDTKASKLYCRIPPSK